MLLSTAQNPTLRRWSYTCTTDCMSSAQQLRRAPHSHAAGHWIPGAATECQLLPGPPSFCQDHVSKGTCISVSETEKVLPILSWVTVQFVLCRVSDLVELGIWMKGFVGLDPKALQFLRRTRFPHGAKEFLPELPMGTPCRDSGREGCSTHLTCQKDHMHPKKAKAKQINYKVKNWINFWEETESAMIYANSHRDPSQHF